LGYIARYIRRLPMADYRILGFDSDIVRFIYNDKRDENKIHEATVPTAEFIQRLIDQIPYRYQRVVRYFGLLAPRAGTIRYKAFVRRLCIPRPRRARRIR